MLKRLIKENIHKLTPNDIFNFALTNGISLTPEEVSFIYTKIKEDWENLLYQDIDDIIKEIDGKLSKEAILKIRELYSLYKTKFQIYL